ncbi:Phospholipid/glycerol acyltransferase domain-containing protein [Stackebrandtia soli]
MRASARVEYRSHPPREIAPKEHHAALPTADDVGSFGPDAAHVMLYWPIRTILRPLVLLFFRPRVRGLDNVPRRGPVILASNHLSALDPVFLAVLVPRRIAFLAKDEFFNGKGLKGAIVRRFMYAVGQLPIDRSGGTSSARTLNAGATHVVDGKALGIYPEGTRSPDGRLYRARTGIARLALDTGAPVVPLAMIGTGEILERGRLLPRMRRFELRVGTPLRFERPDDEPTAATLRSVTDEIGDAIHALSGQEYVDTYASQARRSRPAS